MRLYLAAFKPALVDIALIGVVVPLDAVQRGRSADLPPFRDNSANQEDDELSIRRTSRRLLLSHGPVRASHGTGISVYSELCCVFQPKGDQTRPYVGVLG
jgi:hypothetical protein